MYSFFTLQEVKTNSTVQDEIINMLNLSFPVVESVNGIKAEFDKYLKDFRTDLLVVAENYYIDKVYRNSFSNYYSTKLNSYSEYCVRLSFLDPECTIEDFEQININKIKKCYLGFMVLRPIYPGTIGRTVLNPRALLHGCDILYCSSKIRASIFGCKSFIPAFPHSSQDNEYSTCAETSIWSILEYYGNKYPEYSPILPSKIHSIIEQRSSERTIPSYGLTFDDIALVLKESGLTCKIHYLLYRDNTPGIPLSGSKKLKFYRIFSCYIESGIPLVTGLFSNNNLGHANVCIGKTKWDRASIDSVTPSISNGIPIKHWADVMGDYVFNDDNVCCYEITDFDNPAPIHGGLNFRIVRIFAPLYKHIYMDASEALIISEYYSTKLFPIKDYIIRVYLASSSSFMNAVIQDARLSDEIKRLITENVRMPKFIWVAELAQRSSFINYEVDGIVILDATACGKYVQLQRPIYAAFNNINYYYNVNVLEYQTKLVSLPFKLNSFNNLTYF